MLARIHGWLDQRPLVGDVALCVVLPGSALSALVGGRSDVDAAGIVFFMLLIAPPALRRRAPVAASPA